MSSAKSVFQSVDVPTAPVHVYQNYEYFYHPQIGHKFNPSLVDLMAYVSA